MQGLYAIEPTVLANDNQPIELLLADKFGFDKGRFIHGCPNGAGWENLVTRQIDQLPDGLTKSRRSALLKKWVSEQAIAKSDYSFIPSRAWVENVRQQREQGLRLLTNDTSSDELYPTESSVDNIMSREDFGAEFFSEITPTRFSETEEGLLPMLTHLLEVSDEIYVIDKYLDYWDKRKSGFVELILQLLKPGKHSRCVIYSDYTRLVDSESRPARPRKRQPPRSGVIDENEISMDLRKLFNRASGRTLCWRFLDNWQVHHRSIFSIYGGLSFDAGFWLRETPRRNEEATWLNREQHQNRMEEFSERDTAHVPAIEIEIRF